MLSFARHRGVGDLGELRLADLRSWLGEQADRGAARSAIARHAAAARTFLRWAARTGRIDVDPSLRLAAPRRSRSLPESSSSARQSAMLDVAATPLDDSDPIHVRDRAVLELLYATGIRVEVVALDVDDVDLDQQVARVMEQGAKERMVPFGVLPPPEPSREWLAARRALLGPRSGRRSSWGAEGQNRPAPMRSLVHEV